jgi:hypothetical protein
MAHDPLINILWEDGSFIPLSHLVQSYGRLKTFSSEIRQLDGFLENSPSELLAHSIS